MFGTGERLSMTVKEMVAGAGAYEKTVRDSVAEGTPPAVVISCRALIPKAAT